MEAIKSRGIQTTSIEKKSTGDGKLTMVNKITWLVICRFSYETQDSTGSDWCSIPGTGNLLRSQVAEYL